MAEPHVISALVKKRAELSGEIEHYEQIIKEHKENLTTIDKTIRIFDENYQISTIKSLKKYRNRYFETGEAKVMILNTLRKMDEPVKSETLYKILAKRKAITFETSEQKRIFAKAVANVLNRIEKENLVERVAKEGLMTIWQIKKFG